MLAEVRKEYVFKVIDPPFIPEIKSTPDRLLIGIFGGISGIVLGILLAVLRNYFQSRRKS